MERRIAIKRMALAAGGLLVLPAWANAWTNTSVRPVHSFLSLEQGETLAEMVETIIPASDSLGAKALGVHDFVQKMVADCYEAPVQENLKNGLATVDATAQTLFGKSFATCEAAQRAQVLQKIELAPEADQKEFYELVKNLTIQGFTTSEYVMTKYLNYNMIPGHYYGCAPAPIANK